MLNLMLDLEAFGPRPRGLIVSVGAVIFDDELPPESCVLEGDEYRFYGVIDNQDARDSRFVVDGDTMAWWATQGAAFGQLLQEMCTKGERLEAMFGRLGSWLQRFEGTPLRHWANAPSYDTVMLENAFTTLGMKFPLAYKTERDYRTMMELAHGAVRPDVPATGVHNALFDAIEQAKLATAALQMLRRQPAAPLVLEGYPTVVGAVGRLQAASKEEVQQVVGNPNTRVVLSQEAPAVAKPLGQSEGGAQAVVPVAGAVERLQAASKEEVQQVVGNPNTRVIVSQEAPAGGRGRMALAPMTGVTEVAFVDTDGVLQTPSLSDWREMEHAGALIELLAERPGLAVVVSATDRETSTAEQILEQLPEEIARRTVGFTEVTRGGRGAGGRQAEIESWLKRNPQVTRWVAVDDEAYLYRPDCKWLVATFKWMGWTDDTTEAVRSVLEGRVPEVKLTPSLGGRGSVLPAGWADSEDEFGQRGAKQAPRAPLAQDEVRAGSLAGRPSESTAAAQALAASRGGVREANVEPAKQGGVLKDKMREREERNSKPGGWRGVLGIGGKSR